MKQYTLARPYAKAAFLFAKEQKAVKLWASFLTKMAELLQEESLQNLLKHPKFDTNEFIQVILDKLEIDDLHCRNFLYLLAEKGRLLQLPEIDELFQQDLNNESSTRQVLVKSAMPLSKKEITALEKDLSDKFKQSIEMQVVEDASLIGGLIIESDDYVLDNSLKGQLERLKQSLTL